MKNHQENIIIRLDFLKVHKAVLRLTKNELKLFKSSINLNDPKTTKELSLNILNENTSDEKIKIKKNYSWLQYYNR